MKLLKFKKGNLPVTILVIGIFALCGFALLTFFMSDFKLSNSFVGVDVVKKIISNSDEYLFYKNNGVPDEDLDEFFNITEEYGRKYFHEEKIDDEGILFFGSKKVLLFSIKYQVPSGTGF
ncbi:hypothetical protein COU58_01820 [Candidatus Pacearchaeota archaeon CG10_big_fil_rev_8_21_14_0_10_32_42]|nr:MAG: hypothetical protein COU58_01820 [Candidatus Pacearchaeota archaeon CG10_big_fil_rev_8_21_14_0_10_32_42]